MESKKPVTRYRFFYQPLHLRIREPSPEVCDATADLFILQSQAQKIICNKISYAY